jgi:uncharacterized coiled-coil protein SlyX
MEGREASASIGDAMPDDNDKRITTLERSHDKMEATLDQINKTLIRFEAHIDELFEVKTKLDSVDVIWRRIDELQGKIGAMEIAFQVLKAEHISCVPIVQSVTPCKADFEHRIKDLEKKAESSNAFTNKLFSSLLEKVIWALVVGGAMSAVYLAGKGVFAK